jgi:CheY-like chemotaxis protein/DNA-directed RNA polymerase specialized sigma24 family protein
MTNSAAFITAQVPYLRRFARVLTGSQAIGDSYALVAVEAAMAEPICDNPADARGSLYRALLAVWTGIANQHAEPARAADPNRSAVDFNLTAVAPLPRAAFLLRSMEEFSVDEVATILQRPVSDVEHLIDQAGEELATQISTNVLIVEDEPIISMDLQTLVEQLGHSVPHIARTHQEAVSLAHRCQPGLVLADVHLAENSSGIDAVNDIITSYDVPVIFITAFPDEFLRIKRPEPRFLLAKPYSAASVKAVISQALFFDMHAYGPIVQTPA